MSNANEYAADRLNETNYAINQTGEAVSFQLVDRAGIYGRTDKTMIIFSSPTRLPLPDYEHVAPLCNFTAEIVREDAEFLHLKIARKDKVVGTDGITWKDSVKQIKVQKERFEAMNWVMKELGPTYVIHASRKEHLRVAIQLLSRNIDNLYQAVNGKYQPR